MTTIQELIDLLMQQKDKTLPVYLESPTHCGLDDLDLSDACICTVIRNFNSEEHHAGLHEDVNRIGDTDVYDDNGNLVELERSLSLLLGN